MEDTGATWLIEARWGSAVTNLGWTAIPNVILEQQSNLGVRPIDLNVVLQLAYYWRDPDRPPFPSVTTLAARIGVEPERIMKSLDRMEQKGLIRREIRLVKGTGREYFHLRGLADHALKLKMQEDDDVES